MLLVIIGTAVFVAGSVSLGIPPPEGYGAPRVAPVQVAGVVLFVLLICFILVVSDDITAVFCPFLILCVFACDCYNSFDTFIRFWWLGIVAAAALIFHFVRYRMPLKIGKSFYGILAAGASVLLGGIGFITAKDYFAPISVFYTLALSVGMAVAYLLVRSQLSRDVDYDRMDKYAEIMYVMGVFVCLESVWNILIRLEPIIATGCIPEIQQHNNFATFMLFALPFPFYFARKNRAHLLTALLMLLCLFTSGSRGATVSVIVLLPFLIAYFLITSNDPARKKSNLIIGALISVAGIVGVCAVFGAFSRIEGGFISNHESRYKLIKRAFRSFRRNPFFGAGLGYTGNIDIYLPKKGAFYWYHSMPLQIIGSLGIFGIVAYGYQALSRVAQVVRKLTPVTATLGLSYLGVLVMSCFNPGEFVPVPYELMTVVTFAMLEACAESTSALKNV